MTPAMGCLHDAPGRLAQTLAHSAPAMTPAQRQRAYRQRCKLAATDAIGEEAQASRVTLLALLCRDLSMLDDALAKRMHPAAQSSAKRILRVIVTRYAINLAEES